MSVRTIWATPNGDQLLADIARVSAPGREGYDATKLIAYLIRHKHWSPFEMVSLCLEITTTRDIGRQILRHSTLRPQEFSQRYADVRELGEPVLRNTRMQHPTNRQASLPCDTPALREWWKVEQQEVWDRAIQAYARALDHGIAKEVARAVLPEGLTPTRMFFTGPLRSWLHFCELRMGHGTQAECTTVATAAYEHVTRAFPLATAAFNTQKEN